MKDPSDLEDLFSAPRPPRIVVLGDLMLDRYIWGRVERVSPEAPIQVLTVEREEERPGGAANVVRNLAALGAEVACAGTVGADVAGERLLELLAAEGVECGAVLRCAERPTVVKTRLVAAGQQLLRVDREGRPSGGFELSADRLRELVRDADAVVISDYAKGFITPWLLKLVFEAARASGRPVIVDPKGSDYARYAGATVLTPNRREAEVATGLAIDAQRPGELERAALRLLDLTGAQAAVITLGPAGIYLCTRDGLRLHRPTRARAVFDVTGAGDTVLAVLAWCLARGVGWQRALDAANAAAGLSVREVGAVTVTPQEIRAALAGETAQVSEKCLPLEAARRKAVAWRAAGRKLVFANGCFDLLHPGHVSLLRAARAEGDALVVALNSDASIRRLKGPGRPILNQQARVAMLAALEDVDLVVVFDQDTPRTLIQELHPDVLIKGEDYRGKEVVGRELVEGWGGRVALVPLLPEFSTTALLERIQKP